MFSVFSQKLNKSIRACEVEDLKDEFLCPNPNCDARFTIRAVNSASVSPHFACLPNHPHDPNCLFGILDSGSATDDGYIKSDLETILNPATTPNNTSSVQTRHLSNNAVQSRKYIRTANQLLRYCLSHDLSTEYTGGLTVGDIILDSRNLLDNGNYKGVEGIRLISGQTVEYCESKGYIKIDISTRTSTNKRIFLTALAYMPTDQIVEIRRYLFNTPPGRFSGHPIAVLGEWQKDKDYQVSCTVAKKSNVIYRFAHE